MEPPQAQPQLPAQAPLLAQAGQHRQCAYWTYALNATALEPRVGQLLRADYVDWVACVGPLGLVLLSAALVVMMLFLKSTADDYLSGTLSVMCTELRLAQDVAGATLLALGNGAPDVFSSIAAFTRGEGSAADSDLGTSSLLGGAAFVTTIVLGSVALSATDEQGVEIRASTFGRDIIFLSSGVAWLALLTLTDATPFLSVVFLFLEVMYVSIVVWQSRQRSKAAARSTVMATRMERLEREDRGDGRALEHDDRGLEAGGDGEGSPDEPLVPLIPTGTDERPSRGASPTDEDDVFARRVLTPHYDVRDAHFAPPPAHASAGLAASASLGGGSRAPSPQATATTPGGSQGQGTGAGTGTGAGAGTGHGEAVYSPLTSRLPPSLVNALYWKQLRASNALRKHGETRLREFYEMGAVGKLFWALQVPLSALRALTVPPPEPSAWSKTLVVLHPPMCVLFLMWVFGSPGAPGSHSASATSTHTALVIVALCAAGVASMAIYFNVHEGRPPGDRVSRLALSFVSFCMCVVWIQVVAGEVVAILDTLGLAIGANASVMGLSVLAWGNSIGDLANNVAVAKAGFPMMAVSACVSGPVFNLLVGLGVSLLVLSLREGRPIPVRLDRYATAAACLLVSTLWLTFFVAMLNRFRITRAAGALLVVAYGGFIVVAGVLVLTTGGGGAS